MSSDDDGILAKGVRFIECLVLFPFICIVYGVRLQWRRRKKTTNGDMRQP